MIGKRLLNRARKNTEIKFVLYQDMPVKEVVELKDKIEGRLTVPIDDKEITTDTRTRRPVIIFYTQTNITADREHNLRRISRREDDIDHIEVNGRTIR